jgi:serine protease AprX
MVKKFGIGFLLYTSLALFPTLAQQKLAPEIYMVTFTDKNYNTYQLSEPDKFLSSRSLNRRAKQHIAMQFEDLPVSPAYLDSLKKAKYTVLNVSKWLNAATIQIVNDSMLSRLSNRSFIFKTKPISVQSNLITETNHKLEKYDNTDTLSNESLYGSSLLQVSVNNGQYLFNSNFRGSNMLIAIIDGGFKGAPAFSSLQKLWTEQRVVMQRDFADKTGSTFYNLSHGANVLSIMAGNKEGRLIGTAPQASYALIRSEDAHTESSGLQYEYPVEEFNWVVAAELADSIGADIINSSLGYNLFNDASMNHTYQQMDGKTTLCTQGANIASSKGIIVVISAGNEGHNAWRYLTAPSDAVNILSVGAVNSSLQVAAFSSIGPSADSRVKPDVVALGESTYFQYSAETFTHGNGTSFSAPVISGLTACLWQAYPEKTNLEIIDAIKKSSSQYNYPDAYLGYGIPDFQNAYNLLQLSTLHNKNLTVSPNPFINTITIKYRNVNLDKPGYINITNIHGCTVSEIEVAPANIPIGSIETNILENKPGGLYVVHFHSGSTNYSTLIIKQ